MVNLISKVAIVGAALVGVLYQFFIKTIIFDVLGYGRAITPLSTFKEVSCEKITELGLEACEDMWLHEPTGFLYMACSDSQSRTQWLPAADFLNASGRSLVDRIAVLDTRGSGRLTSRIKWLTAENFSGINGDGTFNLHGFDVRADSHTNTLRILLINHRPPLDPLTGEQLDASKVGANSTIELFQTMAGSDTMRHIRTYAHDVIATPNRVQWVNDEGFVFTNDHSSKTGIARQLEPLTGGGNIGYCDRTRCNIAKYFGRSFAMPNGLVRGLDGLIYIPSTLNSEIRVFSLNEHHTLDQVDFFKLPYPIDNLSVDKNGDIFAATFPMVYKWGESSKDPFNVDFPSTIFKISGAGKGRTAGSKQAAKKRDYVVSKVMEDSGSVLPGTTIAVHDVETGRYFLGGVVSPYITICEPRVVEA